MTREPFVPSNPQCPGCGSHATKPVLEKPAGSGCLTFGFGWAGLVAGATGAAASGSETLVPVGALAGALLGVVFIRRQVARDRAFNVGRRFCAECDHHWHPESAAGS